MSQQKKQDYKKVLAALKSLLPSDGKNIRTAVVDFDTGLWQAVRSTYSKQVKVRGCLFHWTQEVWEKCEQLWFHVPQKAESRVGKMVKQLMALPFLPADQIPHTFEELRKISVSQPTVPLLVKHIEENWIQGYWKPQDWSVYNHSIRTKEDVEGWHRRFKPNTKRHKIHLYRLISLLFSEASSVSSKMKVLSESTLAKCQQTKCRQMPGKVFSYWQKYDEGKITTPFLLQVCSHLNAPKR